MGRNSQKMTRNRKMMVWGTILLLMIITGGLVYAALTTTADTHLRRGVTYWDAGQKDKALIEFRAAAKKDPSLVEAKKQLGMAYVQAGKFGAAAEEFARLVDLVPDSALFHRKLAEAYLRMQHNDEALEALNMAKRLEPDHPEWMVLKAGYLAQAQRNWKESESLLSLAIAKDPMFVDAYAVMGQVKRQQGKPEEARQWLNRGLALEPAHFEVLMGLGFVAMDQEQWKEAEEYFQKVSGAYPESEVPHVALASLFTMTRAPERVIEEWQVALKRQPGNLHIQNNLAETYLQHNKVEEGLKVVNEVLTGQPQNKAAKFLKGQFLIKEGKIKEAIIELQEVVRRQPDFPLGHWVLGQAYEQEGLKEQARREYDILVQKVPNSFQARQRLVALALEGQHFDDAIMHVEALLKLDATHPAVQELAGQAFLQANKPTKAAQQFSELVRTHPDNTRGHFNLGLSLLFAGNVEEAIPELSRAIQQELKLIAPLGSVALALDQAGQAKAAGTLVRFIQTQAPESAVGPYVAGMLAWQRGEKPAQVEARFKEALTKNPEYAPASIQLGKLYRNQGHYDRAIRQFEVVLQQQDAHMEALHETGEVFMAKKAWTEAAQYFRATVNANAGYYPGWNNLAWALAQEGKDLDTALQAAEEANRLAPEKPEILDTLGLIYLKQHNHEQALVTFEQAVRLRSDLPALRYHLALAYKEVGQVEKARSELEAAISLKKDFPEESEARQLLQKLFS